MKGRERERRIVDVEREEIYIYVYMYRCVFLLLVMRRDKFKDERIDEGKDLERLIFLLNKERSNVTNMYSRFYVSYFIADYVSWMLNADDDFKVDRKWRI